MLFSAEIFSRPKRSLATIKHLTKYCRAKPYTMNKIICILAGAALLAACEQKTETAAPTPEATTPPAAETATTPATSAAPEMSASPEMSPSPSASP
jgi:hypothetical protein